MKKLTYYTPLIALTSFTDDDVLNISGDELDNEGAFKSAWEGSL